MDFWFRRHVETSVDYTAADYNAPPAAVLTAGMAGSIAVTVRDSTLVHELFKRVYPNGAVNRHPALGCGC